MYTTVNTPPALAKFIDSVEELLDAVNDPEPIAHAVQARLASLVRDPGWLNDEYREADARHYRTHLLAVGPSRRFSVLSLVWLPGQATPIHDHITWCVVGVMQGKEREQRRQPSSYLPARIWRRHCGAGLEHQPMLRRPAYPCGR